MVGGKGEQATSIDKSSGDCSSRHSDLHTLMSNPVSQSREKREAEVVKSYEEGKF